MTLRWSVSRQIALSLVVAAYFAVPGLAHFPIPPKKGEIGRRTVQSRVSDFVLIDQHGRVFQFAGTRGKRVLASFMFTTCPEVCPLLTSKLAAIQRALETEKRDDYLLLSISTDPARDTPAKLKAYAEAFRADFRRWHFLTGAEKELAEVWKGFGVRVQSLNNGQIQHTTLTTLIDPHGFRRIDYYGDKWREKEILKDILALSSQSQR